MAKEASWSCNLLSGVFGVKVAANEKSSVFGLEPTIAWSASVPDGAGPRSILFWLSRVYPIQPTTLRRVSYPRTHFLSNIGRKGSLKGGIARKKPYPKNDEVK